ncbi:MAG: hypothetical protein HRU15_04750, partial [Planctomycetes bacterium]|nr:hypothetical protein [Planctomycetota bacterium]
ILEANGTIQDVPLAGRKCKKIRFEIAGWEPGAKGNIMGIDNIWLTVKRSDDYIERVKSILNIGGLMRYSKGAGGIFLNQLNIVENEIFQLNKTKKSNIVKCIIGNMGGVFSGSKIVIAGSGLRYTPIKIPDADFNAYVTSAGQPPWFQGAGDFSAIPVGEQTFANMDFFLSDFSTSPVPSVFMLKGKGSKTQENEIKGIKIDRKTDALFFLHNAQMNKAGNWERDYQRAVSRNRNPPPAPTAFQYVVHYQDNKTALVPVIWGTNVHNWSGKDVKSLSGAALAWSGKLDKGLKSAVYAMQWNNPRPDVKITHVDITYGKEGDKWATPAVFAITTAKVISNKK